MNLITPTFIKKLIVCSVFLIGIIGNLQAHSFHNNSCNVNINGEIVLEQNEATITLDQGDVIVLTQSGKAWVNDEALQLTGQQTQDVSDYVSGLQTVVPQAIELAAKAIELTNYAVTEVFTGILGEDNSLTNMINEKLSYLQNKLEAHVNQTPGAVTFNSAFFGGNDSAKSEFAQEIDAAVNEVLGQAAGEFLMSLGQSILSGNGSMSDFEKRMDSLGDNMESAINEKSALLKDDALEVCDTLKQIDMQETKLQNIPELKDLDFINVAKSNA